jgi:hypothetical protein
MSTTKFKKSYSTIKVLSFIITSSVVFFTIVVFKTILISYAKGIAFDYKNISRYTVEIWYLYKLFLFIDVCVYIFIYLINWERHRYYLIGVFLLIEFLKFMLIFSFNSYSITKIFEIGFLSAWVDLLIYLWVSKIIAYKLIFQFLFNQK